MLCVYDEGALEGTPLTGARGFSILIEADGERTLFDTGLRGRYLIHNLDHLGVDTNTVDRVVISHGHRAHVGGLEAFLEKREDMVEVIVTSDIEEAVLVKSLKTTMKRTGMPKLSDDALAKAVFKEISEWTQISDCLFITGSPKYKDGANRTAPAENSLVLMTRNGPVLVCGCCHHGLGRTMSYVVERTGKKVHAVVGGVHMTGLNKKEVYEVARIIKEDHSMPELYLNHCSGQTQIMHIREKLGLKAVNEFYAGAEIRFGI